MIEVKHLSFSYGQSQNRPTLNDLSFRLPDGEITVLMGPSGCGKSTLLRLLMGIESGATGQIVKQDQPTDLASWSSRQRTFGLVPQVPHLFPWKTVRQNISLAVPASYPADVVAARVRDALEVIQLTDSAELYPGAISQGMASRVAFARTLVMDIDALLLDEPFAALDAITRLHLQDWLTLNVAKAKLPALFVTHDLQEALRLGATILVMSASSGRITGTFKQNDATADNILGCMTDNN